MMQEQTPPEEGLPSHYTRQPWWIIPMAGAISAMLPLVRYRKFQRTVGNYHSLPVAMLAIGIMAMVVVSLYVLRSYVKSKLLANIILWVGLVGIVLGLCYLDLTFEFSKM